MNDTAEDYLTNMIQPIDALKLLLVITDDYINEDIATILHQTQKEKDRNTSALLYTLGLIQNDLKELRQKCYNDLFIENN